MNGKFDVDKFFCLIGTNPKDNTVAAGWSARVVGPFSDGLVRINNAAVVGPTNDPGNPTKLAPRSFVYRSHSGFYGIVSSEDGYQNLTRFLFGDARVDGRLEVRDISLPNEVEQARLKGSKPYLLPIRGYCIGPRCTLGSQPPGGEQNSTVFRTYGELFPAAATAGIDRPNHDVPELFTVYLDADAKVNPQRRSLGFSIDLGVLVPEYEIDGVLWLKDHFPGGYIFRDKLNLEAIPPKTENDAWQLRCGFDSRTPNRATLAAEARQEAGGLTFRIPILQPNRPGIDATLVLTAAPWNKT